MTLGLSFISCSLNFLTGKMRKQIKSVKYTSQCFCKKTSSKIIMLSHFKMLNLMQLIFLLIIISLNDPGL